MNTDLLFISQNELSLKESWECLLMVLAFTVILTIDGICYYFREQ
jgi:hypothetical protein